MEVDNEPINFDVSRINCTVTLTSPIETSKYPLVRLKRLTKPEIAKLTSIRSDSSEKIVSQKFKVSPCPTSKRKSEVKLNYMTRSKKQKLFEGMNLPRSDTDVFESTYLDKKPQSKRKRDIQSSELTDAKKSKISEKGLPCTKNVQPELIEDQIQPIDSDELEAAKDRTNSKKGLPRTDVIEQQVQPPTSMILRSKFARRKIDEVTDPKPIDEMPAAKKPTNSKKHLPSRSTAVALNEFSVNEVVWGKLRGWPHWPARVTGKNGSRYELYWFNDCRKSKVYRTQIFKFAANYETFAEKFSKSMPLAKAAQEAMIYMAYAYPIIQ